MKQTAPQISTFPEQIRPGNNRLAFAALLPVLELQMLRIRAESYRTFIVENRCKLLSLLRNELFCIQIRCMRLSQCKNTCLAVRFERTNNKNGRWRTNSVTGLPFGFRGGRSCHAISRLTLGSFTGKWRWTGIHGQFSRKFSLVFCVRNVKIWS